jgi:ATP-dependent Clp protease ATP-binding subunit ClpB
LLQLLDDGRLTDGQGRTVDFKNTVVIMTSNLGSEVFGGASGSDDEKIGEVMEVMRRHFRPEFLNRVDDIVAFHPLGKEHIRDIVEIQLKRLAKRLEDKRITIELSEEARALLAEQGYDPTYGARPLKRVIQRRVLDPLAMEILEGRVHDGDCVLVDVEDDSLAFRRKEQAAA